MRTAVALVLAVLCLVALAPAAVAADPFANYRTHVTSVTPSVEGVTAKAESDGAQIVVTNDTSTPLVILGYQGEPYLRVDSAGVWENQESPATYLNKEYNIDSIPKAANPDRTPRWKKISSSPKAIWHDHRIHWMGAVEPPNVAKDPHHAHLIKTWTIVMRYGKQPVKIAGTLRWHPGSRWSGYLPYGIAAVAVVAAVAITIVGRRRAAGREPRAGASAP